MTIYRLRYNQTVPLTIEQCWGFFSDPKNLKLITPEYLKFQLEPGYAAESVYAGQIISYKIRPVANIPIGWVTEITHVNAPHYFIDEQRFGPYAFWHHEHHFAQVKDGVSMTDIVHYKLPFGVLGRIVNAIKVRHDIEAIFAFRKAKLESLFGRLDEEKA